MKVLVTGGSRGIGASIVKKFRENGYTVDAPTRSELDLNCLESVKKYVDDHKEEYSIVINNAGVNYINYIDELDEGEVDQMLNVNLMAPVYLLRGLVPYMKQEHFGRIVNIGSIWGVITKPGRSIYGITKHGINGLSMSLAAELAPYNILVNTIAPGQTMTELTKRNNTPEEIEKMKTIIPIGRLAEPDEIADAVFFLGNEKNTYITGQQLVVDGGLTLQ